MNVFCDQRGSLLLLVRAKSLVPESLFLLLENNLLHHPVGTHWLVTGDHMSSVVEDNVVHATLRVVGSNVLALVAGDLDGGHGSSAHLGMLETLVALPLHNTESILGQGVGANRIQESGVQGDFESFIDQVANEVLGNRRGIMSVDTLVVATTVNVLGLGANMDGVLNSGELERQKKIVRRHS